jgi:predicted regulator of Ras-like GTPase activity (Roadblock/LC7/MglB family)
VHTDTSPVASLAWLLNDLIDRVPHTRHAVVLSADGLLMAKSDRLARDDGEHFAAVASGIHSLAKGASQRLGGGPPQQAIIELQSATLFVSAAGAGACLAVYAAEDADVAVIAYEMEILVGKVGTYLTAPARAGSEH